jgi:hypothetical protein
LVSSLSLTRFLIIFLLLQLIWNSVARMWRETNNAHNHKTLPRTAYKGLNFPRENFTVCTKNTHLVIYWKATGNYRCYDCW